MLDFISTDVATVVTNLGVIAIIAVYMVRNQTKQNNYFVSQMGEIVKTLEKIAKNVGRTFLTPEQTLIVFNNCLNDHIHKKLDYVKSILRRNNLDERCDQIKKNIESEFRRITTSEANKLSAFNTPAGNLGNFLTSYIFSKQTWELFLSEVFEIVFRNNEEENKTLSLENKLNDLEILMNNHVTELLIGLEGEMRDNTI